MTRFKRISVALFFALWLEFFYKFGATHDVKNFIGAIFVYALYLVGLDFIVGLLNFRTKILRSFVLFGMVGLMAEWFLIGNSPWANPSAIQSGMFVFHAIYPLMGLLLFEQAPTIFRKCLVIFGVFTVLSIAGFFIGDAGARFAWFIWVPLFPYFLCVILIGICRGKKKSIGVM